MAENNVYFGVYFKTFSNEINEEEIRKDFGKYGRIIFVKLLPPRVYINFGSKEEAEHCLLDAADPKYGKITQGRFGPPPLLSTDNGPPPLLSINDRPPPLLSIYDSTPPLLSINDHPPPLLSIDDRPPPLLSIDLPPPLLSIDDGPPCLLSVNDGPPPLISALETELSTPTRAFHTPRKALLPTPPLEMRIDFASQPHVSQSSLSGHDIPPPLVSAISNSNPNGFQSSRKSYSRIPYESYTQKYGNYILIVNVPKNISAGEVEKVLYPHIPIDVAEPESTNIKMKVLFCLVTFNTRDEATKAAKQLDGVELQGQSLRMITLDELILFSNAPF